MLASADSADASQRSAIGREDNGRGQRFVRLKLLWLEMTEQLSSNHNAHANGVVIHLSR
jgi:hypothetical protein